MQFLELLIEKKKRKKKVLLKMSHAMRNRLCVLTVGLANGLWADSDFLNWVIP